MDLTPSKTICEALNIDRSTLTGWVRDGKLNYTVRAPGLRGAMMFDPDQVKTARELAAAIPRKIAS